MESIIVTQTDLAQMIKAAQIILEKNIFPKEIVLETLNRIIKEQQLKPIYFITN